MSHLMPRWLVFLLLLCLASPALAIEEIKIGILAYRAKSMVKAQWTPLATALNQAIPEYNFVLTAYSFEELNTAVAARQVDLVLTNPGSYLLMSHRSGLSAPLATLSNLEQGQPVNSFGGVIFTRADANHITKLDDLRGKLVAAVSNDSLGGFQMQLYELLQLEISDPKEIRFLFTGMPQDKVIEDVLNKRVDVGFIRSGVLESMAKEGKLNLSRIKLINPQVLPGFPVQVSTRLYPEWPLAAMPHTNKDLKRKLATFLLTLHENKLLTQALQIHGFDVPSDYSSVENLLRKLRMPPFDETPTFTLQDIWDRYRLQVMTSLIVVALFLLLSFKLMLINRRLESERNVVQKQTLQIHESEERWKFALEGSGDGVWDVNLHTQEAHYSKQYQTMLGFAEGEFPETFSAWRNQLHPEDKRRVMQSLQAYFDGRSDNYSIEFRMRNKAGGYQWIKARGMIVSRDDEGRPLRMVGTHTDITDMKNAETEVWKQANFDQLTQLPNRRLFRDRIEQSIRKAQREQHRTALLFIDLDRFKEINDTLGHDVGDIMLIEVAERIKHCVRDYDTVARLGGDEFTVILSDLHEFSDTGRIAQCIIDSLSNTFLLKGQECFISASIGISIYPEDADNVTDLIKNADQAMYAAKDEGRSCYRYFTSAMQDSAELRMQLSTDLRRAMQEQQFVVHYQPIVDLQTGAVHKAEALLRWKHPQRGFISPATFIPIAEDIGIIHELGDWVFMQAAAQAQQWSTQHDPNFQISVNMSPLQFIGSERHQNNWIERLQSLSIPGQSIVVEITEGMLINEDRKVNAQLLAFRDAGIQVAIDDFGTGYSSLSYLKKFDIDYLKIDQSFTQNMTDDASDLALCETIIVMAHKLGLMVIAEGVETSQQRDLLKQMGCDYGQGYLFSKPLMADDVAKLLVRH